MNVEAVLFLTLSGAVLAALLIAYRKKDPGIAVRSLPAFLRLKDELGRAAESGQTIHVALGSGGMTGEDAITSLAAIQAVEALADAAVTSRVPPIITVGNATLLPLAQDALRKAYQRNNLAGQYDPTRVRYVAPSPVAYAAGAASIVAAENVTTSAMMGDFGAEVSLIADAGARGNIAQVAAVATPESAGALYPAVQQLAVGEELFAAGAGLTRAHHLLVGLLAQDILRLVLVLVILGAAVWQLSSAFFGN